LPEARFWSPAVVAGHVHKVTPFDGKSSYKTSYVYDRVGNLERVIDPRKNDTPDDQDFTSKLTYDQNHRPVSATDAAGSHHPDEVRPRRLDDRRVRC
jgi:YD repeat-containing protein